MRTSGKLVSALLLCAVAAQGPVHAAAVNYAEEVDGELGFLDTTFTLDTPGLNTISGSSSKVSSIFDNDSFFIALDAGLTITQFDFTFSNGTQTDILFRPQFELQELDGATFLKDVAYNIASGLITTNQVYNMPPPYAFASYRVWLGGSTVTGSEGENPFASYDWNAQIVVSAVPIPAALPLFATGLGLMGLLAWRRRKVSIALV
jgi:hypothetical protein